MLTSNPANYCVFLVDGLFLFLTIVIWNPDIKPDTL